MGWLAVTRTFSWELLVLCGMIAVWLPLHVWSVNLSHREDYRRAGITFFPLNISVGSAVRVLFAFAVLLLGVSLALYVTGGYGWLYLAIAGILGVGMVAAAAWLVARRTSAAAWKLYRLSSFPYLGIVFLAACLDLRFIS